MRRLFGRKAVTIIAAIVSFTAIPAAGIVATATPALASNYICTLSFPGGCVGAPTIGFGDPVELTTGRLINEVDQGYTCCGGAHVFQFQFAADSAKCVGAVDNGIAVVVRACSGGNEAGVNWAKFIFPAGIEWWNNPRQGFLGTDGIVGNQLFIANSCHGCGFLWTR